MTQNDAPKMLTQEELLRISTALEQVEKSGEELFEVFVDVRKLLQHIAALQSQLEQAQGERDKLKATQESLIQQALDSQEIGYDLLTAERAKYAGLTEKLKRIEWCALYDTYDQTEVWKCPVCDGIENKLDDDFCKYRFGLAKDSYERRRKAMKPEYDKKGDDYDKWHKPPIYGHKPDCWLAAAINSNPPAAGGEIAGAIMSDMKNTPSLVDSARLTDAELKALQRSAPTGLNAAQAATADAAMRKAFKVVGEKLKAIEWSVPNNFLGEGRYLYECPACHGFSPNKWSSTGDQQVDINRSINKAIIGHAADCWLNEIIQLTHKEQP